MNSPEKIRNLEELADLLSETRTQGAAVIHCHGVFDLLHIGHIRYLQKAKRLAEILVVTVTADRHVNKGPHRPIFHEQFRADALAALDCVDFVAISQFPTAVEILQHIKPDIYAKGAEFRDVKTPELIAEEKAVQSFGGRVEFIEDVTSSSSWLINNHLSPFPPETEKFLHEFRGKHSPDEIHELLKRVRAVKPLVIGEAILDEYYACQSLGQSAKAPVLSARYESHERYAGGSLAVANHLAGFCEQVTLIALLGERESEEDWIRSQLRDNVELVVFPKTDSPTIVKRRYRESYFEVPLFAVNFLNDSPLIEPDQQRLEQLLDAHLSKHDLTVAADYGHGMFHPAIREKLSRATEFLGVNVQANAANQGLHSISHYPRADYVSLAQRELEIELRHQGDVQPDMLREISRRTQARCVSVTIGQSGCLCYDTSQGEGSAPSLATSVKDRIGAGDAFFAITSLAAWLQLPPELIAFLGNVAGAEAVATVGHSRYLDALPFQRHINSLLK